MRCAPVVASAVVGSTALGWACGIENEISHPREVEVFLQSPTDRVDVLFVVDDSRSMTQEQERLASGFTTFLDELEASASDYQIGVVSTSVQPWDTEPGKLIGAPAILRPGDQTRAAFEERVQMGTGGSDHERGLTAAVEAVWRNPGFIRDDAALVVVFVTDEDDCSDDGLLIGTDPVECYRRRDQLVPVGRLVETLQAVKRNGETLRLGGILGPLDGSCDDAYAGRRYAAAVRMTGGALGRICDDDWTPVLRDLGTIAVGILEQFQLSRSADPSSLQVAVDGQPVPPDPDNGWTYDVTSRLLTFHGGAVPRRGSEIEVVYEVSH